jgi:hypothetical protein
MAKPIKKENNALQPYEGNQNMPMPYMDMNLFLSGENDSEEMLKLKMQQLKDAQALVDMLQKDTDEAVLKILDRNFMSLPFWKNNLLRMIGQFYPWSFPLLQIHFPLVKDFVSYNNRVYENIVFNNSYNISLKWNIVKLTLHGTTRILLDQCNNISRYEVNGKKDNYWFSVFYYNPNLTIESVLKLKEFSPHSIHSLSRNRKIKWDHNWLEAFKYEWHYHELYHNEALPWSEELVEWMKNNANVALDWDKANQNMSRGTLFWKRKSLERTGQWTEQKIDESLDLWDWNQLSFNPVLPFSLSFLKKYEGYWTEELFSNESMYNTVFAPLLNDSIVDKILRIYYY